MAVEKEIIVAVEFGSSKIRGVAGCKNIDGSVQVLDSEQVDARHCIRMHWICVCVRFLSE